MKPEDVLTEEKLAAMRARDASPTWGDGDLQVRADRRALLTYIGALTSKREEAQAAHDALRAIPAPQTTAAAPRASNQRLLGSLKKLVRGYVSLLESARERIIFHGGTCDTVDQMERGDAYLAEARAAIALAEAATTIETPDAAWIIWFEDADRKAEVFTGHGATEAAHRRFEQISLSWNAHLFQRVADNTAAFQGWRDSASHEVDEPSIRCENNCGRSADLKGPQAPIARVTINDRYEISSCAQYAPGLPPGDHDLYCEPLCPHGMPLAENICGPCSQGRPNRPAPETAAVGESTYCRRCDLTLTSKIRRHYCPDCGLALIPAAATVPKTAAAPEAPPAPAVRLSGRDSCPKCGFDVRDHEAGELARCGVTVEADARPEPPTPPPTRLISEHAPGKAK